MPIIMMWAVITVLFAIFYLGYVNSVTQFYRGYSLLRFPTRTTDWLEEVEADGFALNNGLKKTLIDIWAKPNMYRNHADVLVAPEFLDPFLALLRMRGINDIHIVVNDIQKEIDRERRDLAYAMKRSRRSMRDNSLANFNLIAYHRYDKIVKYLEMLSRLYPDLAEIFNITKTYEDRNLIGIKIGSQVSYKPAVFIDAGVHAREWIAPATALYIINKLVTEYAKNPDITDMVDKFDWYIVPVANPDGYEYSMTTDRLWRKTRSRNATINRWCVGADANRNWGYRWGEAGANRSPCSNIYPGSAAFSEAETAGIRDFISYQILDLKIYISLHSYGQLFLAPWGYTNDKPNNYYDQKQAASLAVEAIRKRTGAKYNYGTISELMYPASGTSIDYMQDKGIPYIYGIELRPEDANNNFGFTIPVRFIEPTGEEMISALRTMTDYVIQKKL